MIKFSNQLYWKLYKCEYFWLCTIMVIWFILFMILSIVILASLYSLPYGLDALLSIIIGVLLMTPVIFLNNLDSKDKLFETEIKPLIYWFK